VYEVIVRKTTELALALSLIWWLFNTVVLPRRKESSRSLSHLLMSFFYNFVTSYSLLLHFPDKPEL